VNKSPATTENESSSTSDRRPAAATDDNMTVPTSGSDGGADTLDEAADENPGSLIDHPTDGTDSEDRRRGR
jgi:hypothetical protein